MAILRSAALGFNAAFAKQPSEQITIKANFNDVAQSLVVNGYGLNKVELKIFDSAGADTGNNMILGNPRLDGNNHSVFTVIKAGSDGQNYYARFKTTWTNEGQPDQIIERDLLIRIREKGY